ncbi:MAG: MFS transporter [Eubacteriales bacterium]|nr:MFS transporter [Eubacteriales bacterium]
MNQTSTHNEAVSEKLKISEILKFGIGGAGENLSYNLFYMFFIFFLTTVAGIGPAIAGTISLVAVMWDAITDPLVGFWSDKFKGNKFGKRAAFIIGGAIPLGVSVFLLFCDLNLSQSVKTIYFLIINIAFWLFFTIVDIPYNTAAAEITSDYDTKTKLRTSLMFFASAGQLLISVGIFKFIDFMAEQGQSSVETWRIIGAAFGTLVIISFLVAGTLIRRRELSSVSESFYDETQKTSILSDVVKVFKNMIRLKQFLIIALMAFIFNINLGLVNSSLFFFFMFTLKLDYSQMAMINFWPIILSLPLILSMGGIVVKVGKKSGMIVVFSVLFLSSVFFSFTTPGAVALVGILLAVVTAGATFWIIIYGMVYDTFSLYEYKFEDRKDATILSIISFLTKAGVAIGMWLNGILLQILGVDPTAEVITDSMAEALRVITGRIPMVVAIFLIVLSTLYKINKNNIQEVQRSIEMRRIGEIYSDESFKNIV